MTSHVCHAGGLGLLPPLTNLLALNPRPRPQPLPAWQLGEAICSGHWSCRAAQSCSGKASHLQEQQPSRCHVYKGRVSGTRKRGVWSATLPEVASLAVACRKGGLLLAYLHRVSSRIPAQPDEDYVVYK